MKHSPGFGIMAKAYASAKVPAAMKAIGKHDDGTGPDFAICAQPQWAPASGPRLFSPLHRARRRIDRRHRLAAHRGHRSRAQQAGIRFGHPGGSELAGSSVARACVAAIGAHASIRRGCGSAEGEEPALSVLLLAAGDCGGSGGNRSRRRTALSGDVPAALSKRSR